MAEEKNFEKRHSTSSKRNYSETNQFAQFNEAAQTIPDNDPGSSVSSLKKSKTICYRDKNNESPEMDTLRSSLGFSNSFDSNYNLSMSDSTPSLASPTSRGTSILSLELNTITNKCGNATLDSLSMSQVSEFSSNEHSSSFPETEAFKMVLPSTSQQASADGSIPKLSSSLVTTNSNMQYISFSEQKFMSFSENAMSSPITVKPESHQNQLQSSFRHDELSFQGKLRSRSPADPSSNIYPFHNTLDDNQVKNFNLVSEHIADTDSSLSKAKFLSKNSEWKNKTMKNSCQKGSNIIKDKECTSIDGLNAHVKAELSSHNKNNGDEKAKTCIDESVNDSDFGMNSSYEANNELKENFKSCEKNPGHETFHSPQDLKVADLPKDIQHEDSVTFIKCLSKLVIQISVNSTSDKRSKSDGYHSYIGTNTVRNGSGFIVSTEKEMMKIKCTLKDCYHNLDNASSPTSSTKASTLSRTSSSTSSKNSPCSSVSRSVKANKKSHFVYGGVYIRTNRHVIYDKSEADNALVNFFYQSADESGMVRGHVSAIHGVNNEQDHIVLHVMSHDRQLLNKIELDMINAKSSFMQMLKSTQSMQQFHGNNQLCWVAVISHPHGCPCCISFGRLIKEEVELKRVIKYYDADTCPGSSGGLVVTPTLLHLQWPGAVHSSYCNKMKANVSLHSRCQELDMAKIGELNKNILNSSNT